MGLLQPENLSNHVFCGGVQQDTSGSQSHHNVSAHWRQAHRNGIRSYEEKRGYSFHGLTSCPLFHPHSFFSHIMYAILISFLQSVENRETCTSDKFYKTFPCFKCSVTKTMKSFKELKPILQQLPHTSTVPVQIISQASPPAVLCLWLTRWPIKCFLLLQLLMLKLLHFLLMAEVLRLSHPHPP